MTLDLRPVALHGRFARLVPLQQDHVAALFAVNNPAIWQWFPVRIETLEDMQRLVDKHLAARDQGQAVPFTIIEQATGEIVGSTRLHTISHENRSIEIGKTWLTPRVWRSGINRECKYLLLGYCFEVLKLVRVQLKTDLRNIRSQRAIEGLGAVREGVWRQHWILPNGTIRDSVMYSIIWSEWPDVKMRLENQQEAHGVSLHNESWIELL